MYGWLILLLVFVLACTPVSQSSAETSLVIGNTQPVGGIRLSLLGVVEDSRCPIGVQCIWAGRLVANVSVQGALFAGDMLVNSLVPSNFTDGNKDYTLALTRIFPDAGFVDSAKSYRLTFKVSNTVNQ
ncbi:MAG: hypothetical protein Q7R96_00460 [Nanoarchaeota archaeon]|nr:hypothetical protein [Nanoarchaeota archaeon]